MPIKLGWCENCGHKVSGGGNMHPQHVGWWGLFKVRYVHDPVTVVTGPFWARWARRIDWLWFRFTP